jgi:hypothetical protein
MLVPYNLRATLDWSYETLRRAERTALCRLAVFTTTFDTQAACSLMVDEEIKATDVPERLTDLAEQSLLTVCWAPASRFSIDCGNQMMHFLKKMALVGGLLQLVAALFLLRVRGLESAIFG